MADRQLRDDRLMTIKDVADYLRKHPKTIRRWIAAGDLPAIKAGREWLISELSLRKFLSDRWHG